MNRFAILLAVCFWPMTGEAAMWEISQITTDPHQQSGPVMSSDLIAWTDFRGSQGTDIWGYNLTTGAELILVEAAGYQSAVAIQNNQLLYNEWLDDTNTGNIWLRDLVTGQQQLVAGGSGSRSGGGISGDWVVYTDNYGTGTLYAHNIETEERVTIASGASRPKISGNIVVWYTGVEDGMNTVRGYDLSTRQPVSIVDTENGQQLPDIYDSTIVWQDYSGTTSRIMTKDLLLGITETVVELTDQAASYPTISEDYIAWRQTTDLFHEGDTQPWAAIQNVWIKDLLTGEISQLTDYEPQQVSPSSIPYLYGDKIAWKYWNTGNGDIYLAQPSTAVPEPSTAVLFVTGAITLLAFSAIKRKRSAP